MCMLPAKPRSPAPTRAARGGAGGIAPRLAACRGAASVLGVAAAGAAAAAAVAAAAAAGAAATRWGSGGFDTRSTCCEKPRHGRVVDPAFFGLSFARF